MDPEVGGNGLKRALGPLDATCVVVGAIIGVGIFFTPSRVARLAGSGSLAFAAWAIGGAIALTGALTFAALGRIYPRTGAQYEALRDAYGPFPAFLFVFCNATAIQASAIAIIALVCAAHLELALGRVHLSPGGLTILAALLIVGLALANCVGVRWGSRIQNATVLAKVAALLMLVLVAFLSDALPDGISEAGSAKVARAPLSVFAAVFAALVPALFSYGGWQHALWIAGEVRHPQRDVPLAIIWGVVIVVAVYLLVNWAYLNLLGVSGVAGSTALASDALATVWPRRGARLIALAVAVSALGVLNAQLLSGPRLILGMARDGRFFRAFASVHPRWRTPVAAIVLLAAIALTLLFAAGQRGVDKLLTGAVFIDGCFFGLTGVAVFVLRKKRADATPSVRVPGYPWVPLLFVVGEIAVVIGAYCDPVVRGAAYIGVGWILAAAVCYGIFFRKTARA